MHAVLAQFVADHFKTTQLSLPPDFCTECGRKYAQASTLKKHMKAAHCLEEKPTPADDSVDMLQQYWIQLARLLLVRKVLKEAVHDGDGAAVSRIIKYLHLYFRKLGYPKYALACLEFTAQVSTTPYSPNALR